MEARPIEIFCGTGGVGKTTLACARAISLAGTGRKVLLLTIDPSKRLKQALSLNDDHDLQRVPKSLTKDFELDQAEEFHLDAKLISPTATLQEILKNSISSGQIKDNKILEVLARPYSGMNEIIGLIEVQKYLSQQEYDTIILDTPPGKHFIDFLKSTGKITHFFDKSFEDIFAYLKAPTGRGFNIMKNVIGSGVKKLLSYLEKVTGPDFVSTFIEAVNAIYNNKAVFLNALRFQENIKSEEQCNWVLVTSTEHMKSEEALNMQKSVKDFIKARQFLAVNKVLETELEHWAPETTDMKKLKDSLVMRQQQVVDFARKNTGEYLGFPEIFALSPLEHLKVLVKTWGQHN